MSDWPRVGEPNGIGAMSISTGHALSLGSAIHGVKGAALASSVAWPLANRAVFVPFRLPRRVTVMQAIVGCGATAGGNFDVGVYDKFGNRLVSSGTIARVASANVIAPLTNTDIGPGLFFMALACDATNTFFAGTALNIELLRPLGLRQMAAAFVLPATATFAQVTGTIIPIIQLDLIE